MPVKDTEKQLSWLPAKPSINADSILSHQSCVISKEADQVNKSDERDEHALRTHLVFLIESLWVVPAQEIAVSAPSLTTDKLKAVKIGSHPRCDTKAYLKAIPAFSSTTVCSPSVLKILLRYSALDRGPLFGRKSCKFMGNDRLDSAGGLELRGLAKTQPILR